MSFILFIIGVVFTCWSVYEIVKEESTLVKTYLKSENPKMYWVQLIFTLLIGLVSLYLYYF